MDKNLLIIGGIVVVALAVIVAGVYFTGGFGKSSPIVVPNVSGIIFFYGDTCPHCKNVEDFIKANNIDKKVKYAMLEVFHDQNNAALLLQKAQICGINQNQLGVPLVWDGKKCYMGEPDVTNFFKAQAGIK